MLASGAVPCLFSKVAVDRPTEYSPVLHLAKNNKLKSDSPQFSILEKYPASNLLVNQKFSWSVNSSKAAPIYLRFASHEATKGSMVK
jgi:hypothetical protein